MTILGILIAIFIGLAIVAIFVAAWSFLPKEDVTGRMQEVFNADATDTGGAGRLGELSAKGAFRRIDKGLFSVGFGKGLSANLLEADLKITTTEYILIVFGAAGAGALLGYLVSGHPVSVLVAMVICFFIPPAYVSYQKSKRRRMFSEQLPEALAQLSGALRAGYSIPQSLDVVQQQMPWPIGDEFRRVVREIQLGQSLNAALVHLSERIVSDDLIMVISAINIHQQVGGNLASILDTVSETIRERVRIKREIQVLTAQQRISGYVLVALPIALAGVLLILNPEYEMRLFTPGLTLCIPIGALISMAAGYFIMQRIIDIEV